MEEPRLFNKGMNMDLAVEFIPDGQYRYANNVRAGYSDGDSFGTIESALGNIEITDIDIPLNAGEVYKCVGQVQDKTANKVYYLLFNSATNHRIMEYDVANASLVTVMIDLNLNFNPDFLVTGINVIYLNPDTPLLYWTDGGAPNSIADPIAGSTVKENPPRMININKAKQYMLGNTNPTEAYVVIDVQTLDAIKWPSPASPSCQIMDDPTYSKNNIRTNLFQFQIRYVYDNSEKSAWSPWSKVVNPVHALIIDNATYLPFFFDNRIDITFDTGAEIATKIEIAIRNLNVSDSLLVEQLNKYDDTGTTIIPSNSSYTYTFYNDRLLTPLLLKESILLYDNLPRTAKAQEYIDSNVLVYGNTKEQFDLPTPDVSLVNIEQRLNQPDTLLGSFTSTAVNYVADIPPPIVPFQNAQLVTIPNPFPYPAGSVLQLTSDSNVSYVVSLADLNNINTFRSNLVAFLQSVFPSDPYVLVETEGFYITSPPITFNPALPNQFFVFGNFPQFNTIPPLTFNVYSFESGYSNWLSGFNKTFGLVYYDRANRSTSVLTENNFNIQVPSVQGSGGSYLKRNFIGWSIDHKPPIYATHYQWVARYTAPLSFIDFSIRSATNSGTQTLLDLTPIIDYSTKNPSSILSYAFTQGDRCQFLTISTGTPFPNLIDVAVNGFDEGTNILSVDQVDISSLVITTGALIRVYTPPATIDDEATIFYEFGQQFEVGDAGLPTRYHKGQTQDQTSTQPATGIFDRGDVWIRPRRMATTNNSTFQNYWVEDANFSDFYNSKVWDKGRPNIFDPNYSEVHLITKIPFSDTLTPNTQVNGLNRFYPDNYREYEQKYRSIQLLKNKNRRLVCFQELKVGIIPILARLSYDQQNNSILAETDQVLNPIEYHTRENGIGLNPESYAEKGDVYYFCDTIHGDILRSAQNGLTAISDYGLHNYITDLFGRIQKSGVKVNIFAVYNERFDQVEFCVEQTRIKGSEVLSAETFAFFEPDNYWASFYDYHPEMMSQTNSDIVTFKDGRVWLHNQGSTYANFYGVQYNSDIEAISNQGAKENKAYHSMSMDINQMPEVPTITTSLNQLSNLSNFTLKEGRYYKGFRRDLLTVGVTDPIVNGNRMRGKWMSALIRIGSATYGRLFSVTFNYAQSPINNR